MERTNLVEIGVTKDNGRVLATQLERDPLHQWRRLLQNACANSRRPGKRDKLGLRVKHEWFATHGTRAKDDVDDAWWQASLVHNLRQTESSQRSHLARFRHCRITVGFLEFENDVVGDTPVTDADECVLPMLLFLMNKSLKWLVFAYYRY